jgi:hypothetical protein
MAKDINSMTPESGRMVKEDNSIINAADILAAVYDAVNGVLKTSAALTYEGDISIGAVELKDSLTEARVEINMDGSLNSSIIDIASGMATSGTKSTIVDATKNFITNMLTGAIAEIDIGNTKYFRKVLSNTNTSIAIDIIAGTPASGVIGSGANGTVTASSVNDGIGGNEYTIQALLGVGANVTMSVLLTGLNLVVTLGTNGAGTIDMAKNTAALIATAIDALPEFTAVASGTGADSLNGTTVIDFTGGEAIIAVGPSTKYKIKSTKTINNPIPIRRYVSQNQIGTDIDFTFDNNAVINAQATPIDIIKPVSPSEEYQIIVHNPSTITDLTIKVFAISTSLLGTTRYAYITSLTVPKAATITGTTLNTYAFYLSNLFNGSNVRLQISNNTVLGAAEGFAGTIRIREV